MRISRKSLGLASIAISGVAVLIAVPSLANHSWGSYHWSTTDGVVRVEVFDHTTGSWQRASEFAPSSSASDNLIETAVGDWNASPNIGVSLTADGSGDANCGIVVGEIHVCNADYGDNGWLGIASISAYRGRYTHIAGGATKLNDFYFDSYLNDVGEKVYDSPSWRQLVACQEIGHDFGLGHQNENFATDATKSCMEYTRVPQDNEHPDAHDMEQLAAIYAHDVPSDGGDGGTTGPGPGKKGGGKNKISIGNAPAAWGQAIGYDAQGRANLFKRSSASFDIITHVTWAPHIDAGHDHDEAAPRRHSGEVVFPGS